MNKAIKKLFPLICFCLMFSFAGEVFATTTFSKYQGYLCYNKNNYKIIKLGGKDWYITDIEKDCTDVTDSTGKIGAQTYVIKTGDNKELAFCADKSLEFNETTGTQYKIDPTFTNLKGCATELNANGTVKSTGDCSEMVGYVIGEGLKEKYLGYNGNKVIDRSQFSTSYYIRKFAKDKYGNILPLSNAVEVNKWWNAQMAVWIYLGKFAPDPYDYYNKTTKNNVVAASEIWDKNLNETPIKIIKNAFENYKNRPANLGKTAKFSVQIKNNNGDYVNIGDGDRTFYYIPNGSGDSVNNGVYTTRTIKITNLDRSSINFTLTGPSSASGSKFAICDAKTKKCGVSNFNLAYGKSKEVFFVSYHDFNGSVKFSLTAGFETTLVSYNSKRYTDGTGHQGVVVGSNGSIDEIVKEYSFTQKTVEHRGCLEPDSYGDVSKNLYPQNKSTEPISKVCANNLVKVKDDVESKKNQYEVNFKGCTTMTIDLDNGQKVGIILTEVTYFKFGTLDPNHSIYPGEGFSFSDNATGISTNYQSKVVWDYVNKINGKPYFYNPSNPTSYEVTSVIKNKIENEIKKKLLTEFNLTFSTFDSNDAKNTSLKLINIPVKIDTVNYNDVTRNYTLNSKNILMNDSYFSLEGKVNYIEKTSIYLIDGGKKYYIPIDYKNNSFPFDINTFNLSVVPGIEFYYKADCNVLVDNGGSMLDIVRYRSIDHNNPFPKAKTKNEIPANWRNWYWNNSSNIARLKNTFQHFPDKPLYKIVIDFNKLNKINAINDSYMSWKNMNFDGSNNLILNSDFEFKYPNNRSYCKIGEFSIDCDS